MLDFAFKQGDFRGRRLEEPINAVVQFGFIVRQCLVV
jgi:hypothetical protein